MINSPSKLRDVNACVIPSAPLPDTFATMANTVKVTADIDIIGIISVEEVSVNAAAVQNPRTQRYDPNLKLSELLGF